jgi:hypothetical protein
LDDLDFPEPIAPAVHAAPRQWRGPLVPFLGLSISLFFLSEERASLAYYLSFSPSIDLGTEGAYRLKAARDEAFARIQGQLGGSAISFQHGWQRRELVPLLDTPILIDRPAGSAGKGPTVLEGRMQRDDRLPQFRKVIEVFLKRDLLAPPGTSLQTDHVWVLREGSRPWHLDGDSAWCLLLMALVGLNAWWVGERLWALRRFRPLA